jgi:hypothetical protein
LSPSPPPACRPPARKARVPLLLRDQV